MRWTIQRQGAGLVVVVLLLAGCGPGQPKSVYQDEEGFRLTPPPGWSERARPAAVGAGASGRPRALADLPLPPLGAPAGAEQERLLVRYDRLTAGRQAWLRVTAANLPASASLEAYLSAYAPRPDWRRESEVEKGEAAGRPAVRVVFRGRWDNQDYLNETVAVRKGERAYFITASFPAADESAREQVRRSAAEAAWR